jgi:phosphopantetheinyl transferase (holo-ACP synthase)
MGVDIVDTSTRPSWVENFLEFLDIYRKQLATEEIHFLLRFRVTYSSLLYLPNSLRTSESQYFHFYLLWALKESYVKAIGVGIVIDLTKVFEYFFFLSFILL